MTDVDISALRTVVALRDDEGGAASRLRLGIIDYGLLYRSHGTVTLIERPWTVVGAQSRMLTTLIRVSVFSWYRLFLWNQ